MSKDGLKIADSATAAVEENDRFHASLSQCLHAMGQRLTVLRWAVAASATPGITQENLRKHLSTSAEQVELVCGLFNCMREFVNTSQFPANCGPVELSKLLSLVVEDRNGALLASDLTMEVFMPEGLHPPILADIDRTAQALIYVVKIAAFVASPGDVIELRVAFRSDAVELIVRNERAHGKTLTSLDRLTLAQAEADIRSQQGEYMCAEDPFRVSLTMPVQRCAQEIGYLNGGEARYEALANQRR